MRTNLHEETGSLCPRLPGPASAPPSRLDVPSACAVAEAERLRRRLDAVARIGRVANSRRPLGDVLHAAADHIYAALGGGAVGLYLVEDGALRRRALAGEPDCPTVIDRDLGDAARAARAGGPVFIRPLGSGVGGGGARCAACAIRADGELRGLVVVQSPGDPRLTDDDLIWLETVADQVGLALAHRGGAPAIAHEGDRVFADRLRSARLEAAGRVAGQVAHDVNNLLGPLVGYPELIKLSLPPDHPATAYCDAMVEGAQRIVEINQDLLMLGRRGCSEKATADVAGVVRDAVAQADGECPAAATPVEVELAGDVWPVHASTGLLARALANLIVNAREATSDGGTVAVEGRNVTLDAPTGKSACVPPGRYVRLTVRDTGCGMVADVCRRAFDVYFTTKRHGARRGAGLGLSVTQSIVSEHGGVVDVDSEAGVGSTFTVYLPPSPTAPG